MWLFDPIICLAILATLDKIALSFGFYFFESGTSMYRDAYTAAMIMIYYRYISPFIHSLYEVHKKHEDKIH